MPCQTVRMPGGGAAIVCSRTKPKRRCGCGKPATRECDWIVGQKTFTGPARTCDAPLCASCTHEPAPEKDLCPVHAEQWRARQARNAGAR